VNRVVEGAIIPMDRFIRVDKVIDQNFEDVSLVDFDAVSQTLSKLKRGEPAELSKVSFQRKQVIGTSIVQIPPGKVIILDGMYALNRNIRPLLDVTISLSGGVHLDLLNRVMREVTPKKNTIEKITQIVFPMYKAFIEPDTRAAKIRITGSYNPMTTIADPLYVCRARYADCKDQMISFMNEQSSLSTTQREEEQVKSIDRRKFKDIYLYPPKYDPNSGVRSDRSKWIRIRNDNGKFYLYFYNEMMNSVVNVRPQLYFEISVKTLGGLLSLGYQIGAVIDRETATIYDKDGIQITVDRIMGTDYVQIKGKDRTKVIKLAEKLKVTEHHIPQSFLYLHFRNLSLKNVRATSGNNTNTQR
jgi:uridine kinase